MRILINKPIYIEIIPHDLEFLNLCTIFFKDSHILEQKCDLHEKNVYALMELIESYGYDTKIEMYEIGRFHLIVE